MNKQKREIKKEDEILSDELRREFMKKFGRLAATVPAGMFLLMGPGASRAQASTIAPPPGPPP